MSDFLSRLADTIASRRPDRGASPDASYVARLLAKGPDHILKKIGEETAETIMAAKDGVPEKIIYETADLWFHCMVMLEHYNLRPEQVLEELARREGVSGIAEKASRPKESGDE